MKNIVAFLSVLTILCFVNVTSSSASTSTVDLKAKAKDLATLFRSARGVIAKKQKHINDEKVGDKGLSPENVVKMALENYKASTGQELDGENPDNKILLTAVREVMKESQVLINEKGKGFKGFLPAVFARMVATRFSEKTKGKISIKLTAPKEYVRNRKNRPDKWEHKIIETNFRGGKDGKNRFKVVPSVSEKTDKGFRFILPEYYGKGCLSCHGDPKGERDITGGKKEGGKLGELGGAISIVIKK